jgi:hypothetical protein
VLTFAPGTVAAAVEVPVHGDRILEFDEAFRLDLSSATGATIAQAQKAVGSILNDEPSGRPGRTLGHGMRQTGDLSMPAMFRIAQDPLASYEVSVDATGGVPYFELARMEGFGVESEPVNILAQTYGRAPSLRWFNGPGAGAEQYIRFSISFGERGKAENVYRLRMYETTLAGPRFVNDGSQLTTVIVQNAGSEPVTGAIHFFDSEGIPRHTEPFSLAPRASLVKPLADIPALTGVAGSLTVAHDGRYGALVGKAVSFQAATGLCFDHLLVPRPR